MALFYFNDCHPKVKDKHLLLNSFSNTLNEYKTLKEKFGHEVEGVVSIDLKDLFFLDNYGLGNIISEVVDKGLRNYAYQVFSKYPLESFFDLDEIMLDERKYIYQISSETLDAFYLKIAHDNSSYLFSLAIHSEICKNQLIITDNEGNIFYLNNLFGEKKNTQYIEALIIEEVDAKKNNLELLRTRLNFPTMSSKFIRSFEKSSGELQENIIMQFEEVIKIKKAGGKISENLLKDVTPEKETEIILKELKIRDPEVMRLYFSENNSKIYLASLEKKPLKDKKTTEQSDHIKNAISLVKQLILVNR